MAKGTSVTVTPLTPCVIFTLFDVIPALLTVSTASPQSFPRRRESMEFVLSPTLKKGG